MKIDLQIYDLDCNDGAVRMVYGFAIQDEHTCRFHSISCKTVVYFLSSTSNHSWMNAEWCQEVMEDNGYHKMTPKDQGREFVVYTPYKTEIRGEPFFTHLYVLRLFDDKWYVGLTANLQDTLKAHQAGRAVKWTKEHPVMNVEEIITFERELPEHEAIVLANKKVVELSKDYSFDNVEGGTYL
jgi:predicted GIY-YIG superfamily endonuclease